MNNEMSEERLAELKSIATNILVEKRARMLESQPFIGAIAMSLNIQPTRDCRNPTACTDGNTIFFDIDFLSKLKDEERTFVLAHEVWHNVMLHFARGENKMPELFNIASDLEVNQLLVKDGFAIPKDLLMPNNVNINGQQLTFPVDLSAEEYYDILIQKIKNLSTNNDGDGNKNERGKDGQKGSSKKSAGGQFDKHITKDTDTTEESAESDVTDKYGKVGFDKDFNPRQNDNTNKSVEKMRERIVSAAQQVMRQRGTMPGHISKIVNNLIEPKISWKEILNCAITSSINSKTNWNKPNRRFAYSGTYLPSHHGEMLKIAVGIDTSGSTEPDLNKFLSEVNGIVKSFGDYQMFIIQCDTEVKCCDEYNEEQPLDLEHTKFEFKGFGGTTLHPIFDYINNNELDVDFVTVFTDGECEEFEEADQIDTPVLWVFSNSSNHPNIKFGQKINMEE